MKNVVYILLLTMLLASCSNEKGTMAIKELTPVDTLNVEVGSPSLIKIVGNQLFIDYPLSGEYNIDVIDIQNDSIMYSFAKKGQGANEFLQIMNFDVFPMDGGYRLGIFDNMQRKFITYSIDSLNKYKGNCVPEHVGKLDMDSRYLELYKTEYGYVSTGRTESKFTLLNNDLSYRHSSCDYLTPENRNDDDFMSLSKANYGRSYLSEDRKLLINVVFMAGTISVYEVGEDSVVNKWNYTSSGFEYEADGNRVRQLSPTGYLAAGFAHDSIIGLYSGEEKKEGTNYGTEFHVFNMQGELLGKYSVTSRLYNFCVSPVTGLLYAISYESNPKILVYRL